MPDSEHNLSRIFLRSCENGDLQSLKSIEELKGIKNWTIYRHDVSGDTGLHVAARQGFLDIVEYLCDSWQQPSYRADVKNKDMKRPLHEAAQFARFDVLRYLIEQDVTIDCVKRGDWSPLMLACTKSGIDARKCVQSLLKAGANPCMENKDGWNSLFIACRTGDAEIVKLLLTEAPNCIHTRSRNGRSALHIAAFHGAVETIERLISANPDLVHARDSSGSTAIHESAKSNILVVTQRLVELGADPQAVDDVGQNILHIAAACENLETIEYILANNLVNNCLESKFGLTPMMVARRNGKDCVAEIFTKFGLNK